MGVSCQAIALRDPVICSNDTKRPARAYRRIAMFFYRRDQKTLAPKNMNDRP